MHPEEGGGELLVGRSGGAGARGGFELRERDAECCPGPVVELRDRSLGFAHPVRDLTQRQVSDVVEHQYLALLIGEPRERCLQTPAAVPPELVPPAVAELHLGERDLTSPLQVIERRVLGHPEDPGREGDLALLVLPERSKQLHENVVGQILGLVRVVNNALDPPVHVPRIGDVQIPECIAVATLRQPNGLLGRAVVVVPGPPRVPRAFRPPCGGRHMGLRARQQAGNKLHEPPDVSGGEWNIAPP